MKDEKLENIAMIFTIVFIVLIILTVLAIGISSIAYDVIYHSKNMDYINGLNDNYQLGQIKGIDYPSYGTYMKGEGSQIGITYTSLAITSGVLGGIIFILGFIGLLNGALD